MERCLNTFRKGQDARSGRQAVVRKKGWRPDILIDDQIAYSPLNTASSIARMVIPRDYVEVAAIKTPDWCRNIIEKMEEESDKYLGFTIPSLSTAIILPNTPVKKAAADHEVYGHVEIKKGTPLSLNSIAFFSGLCGGSTFGIMADAQVSVILSAPIFEALGVFTEIDSLKALSKAVTIEEVKSFIEVRKEFLENIDSGHEWLCNPKMCPYRIGLFMFKQLQDLFERIGLSTQKKGIFMQLCKYVATGEPGAFSGEPHPGPTIIASISVGCRDEIRCESDIVAVLNKHIPKTRPGLWPDLKTGRCRLGRVYPIRSFLVFIKRFCDSCYKFLMSRGLSLAATLYTRPLRNVLMNYLAIICDKDATTIYIPKSILNEIDLDKRGPTIKAFLALYKAGLEAYPMVAETAIMDWWGCGSRNGSECKFRDRVKRPRILMDIPAIRELRDWLEEEARKGGIVWKAQKAVEEYARAMDIRTDA